MPGFYYFPHNHGPSLYFISIEDLTMSFFSAAAVAIVFLAGCMIWDIVHAPGYEPHELSEHETRGQM